MAVGIVAAEALVPAVPLSGLDRTPSEPEIRRRAADSSVPDWPMPNRTSASGLLITNGSLPRHCCRLSSQHYCLLISQC